MEINIQELTKIFGNKKTVLNDLTIELKPGITGLLGPNGAGKSTLIKLLTELETPTSGKISYSNDAKGKFNLKAILGYVPQSFGLPETLTGLDYLRYMSAAKGIDFRQAKKKSLELLQAFNLSAVASQPISTYSGGMKQRLGIAQALLNQPQLLILDEPTVGLDPDERLNLKQLMTEIASETIVLLSTHIVSDIESVASDIIILNQGEVQAQGETETLLEAVNGYVWEQTIQPESYQEFQNCHLISNSYRNRQGIRMRFLAKIQPEGANSVVPTLEDVYLFYTHCGDFFPRKTSVTL